jgi:hypothetical protein
VKFTDAPKCFSCNQAIKINVHIRPVGNSSTFGTIAEVRLLNKVEGGEEKQLYLSARAQCYNYACRAVNLFYYVVGEQSMRYQRVFPAFTSANG